jgi:Na+/H+-dicarboxylate symporter
MKKLALHWKILIGMALGVIFGLLMSFINGGAEFVGEFVKPFGTIFINLLKLIAIPLILASLIKGVSDLKDISKLSQMGGRTILTYLSTTLVAVVIGLILVNSIQPGKSISIETRKELVEAYASDADQNEKSQLNKVVLGGFNLL